MVRTVQPDRHQLEKKVQREYAAKSYELAQKEQAAA